METPKKISMATLEKFKAATAYPKSFESGSDDGTMYTDLIAKYGNYRPLQDKNGRTVYSTSGTTTPCGAVAEPMCSVSSKVSHSWSYDRCDSHYGPTSSAWTSGTSCNNQKGSPINVCGAVPFPGANPTVTTTGWAMTRDMDIKNNGHTIQANVALYAAAPTTDVGSLSSVVGHGTNYSSHKWVLEQVHFHWGRTGKTDEGSEHYLQGMAYPLEAHFVHHNSAHGTSVGSAAGTGHAEALLVVGVMFDLNAAGSEPAALTTIADGVAEALYEPKHLSGSVQLSTIYDGMGDFYSYAGSLTTPSCNEMVTWVVMETPKKISMATLEKFKAATAYPKSFESGSDDGMMYTDLIAKYGNYRPLQDKNGRTVYSTSGTTTPCGAVAEPMCSVSSKVSHSWSYDRCDSHYGPTSSAWTSGTSCNNQKGSPINVCGAVPFPGANPTVTTTGWAMTRDMDIKNNGHTIQANVALYAAAPTTDVGSLSSVVGHGTNYSSHKWVLEQVHFHWGRTGKTDEGSEHYLQGMAYPLEAHFVHYNSAHGTSVGSAAGTGHAEALLVVGVMFDLNAAGSEPAALTTIADGVAEALYEPKHLSGSVQLSTIYDGMGDFYSYAGSLTTPGCNEMVTWVVMETPKKISMATLEKFKAATAYPKSFESGSDDGMMYTDLIAKYGNYRPLQDKNGRTVYSTSGTTTPCGAVAEPMCSVSSKVSHSWSYDRCDSHYGPTSSAWTSGTSCNNQKGSPINVCGAVPFPGANPTVTTTGWAMTRDMDIKNNGHTIQANVASYAAAPTTDVGSLSSVVGHGTNYSSHKWVLEQVHFHWGRTGKTDEGSEHYLQGMAYPLEAHFVHYNSAHGTSVGSAAGTGHAEALLVVGVMFDLNAAGSEPAALTTIADGVAEALYEPKHLSGSVQLSTIYDGMGDFYSYAGSLTTPGCNEMVTWVVMETPKKISMATLEKFKAATAYPKSFESGSDDGMMYTDLIAKYGNYRPLQDKNGRTVYSTSGTTTPCGAVAEPMCSVSSKVSHSWSYDRCDSHYGPTSSAWTSGTSCNNQKGSPINVCGAVPFPGANPTVTTTGWAMTRDMDIKNNGHTIQANVALYAAAPTTDVGSLSSVVGHGTNYSSHKWVLEQVHFHWGRTGKTDEGSEHYLQGMAYPLEAHFVHYNSAHGTSVGSAAGTGHAEALLVVGVMFDLNAAGSEPAALTTIADGVAEALYEPKHLSGSVQLSTIYDGMGDFYSYAGSLTTPGCNQMVTWVVMETPKKISMATLEKFKAATAYPKSFESGSDDGMMYTDLIAKYGNYRPLQDKNGRTVYSTSGTTTPCGAVAEPMCSVSSKVSHSWSYDRCDSHYGPTSSAWTSGTSCNNQKGSPINVCGAVPFPGANPTVTTTGWAMTRDMDIKNNGHTIQANVASYAAAPTTDVGSLSSVVGHGTNYSSHKWVLEQVHFHWGRTGKTDEGSEHYLQGMAYPLEAHFVHYNSAHGTSVGSAAGTGHTEALLVVGVMFDLNAAGSEPAALTTIADGVAEALYEPKHLSGSVQLSTIYDGMGDFYSYAGSLTTPGCNEMVTWVVMETPKKISMATLEKFKAATAYPKSFESGSDDGMMYTDLIAKYGNYRPLQDKNGRTVYSTSGTTTPCGAVAEPMCSVSSKVSHSWSYDRCDSHYGPTSSAWTSGTSCNNQKGSPINVCGAVPFPGANPTVTTTGWAMTRDMDIKNNGHTIQANVALYAAAPTTDVGSLSSVVGHGTNYSSHKWVLEQVHFHWGRTGKTDEGSEHYLQGMAYPLEAHFVHHNSAHGTSVGSAAGTGHAEALLVVGVMFDLNAAGSEPAALTTIADGVAEALYEPKHLSGSVQLSTIYDGMGDFYSYAGSLTTPGCNEMVTWVVMETPKKISMATLEKFKAATAYPKSFESGSDDGMMYTDLIAKYGNYRPLQDKNGRTVYSTSGTTTPCGAVAEPMCSVSSKVSHSWSYDCCNSHYGPTSSAWTSGTSCNNQKGSPINVCGAVPFPGANPTVTTTGWAMTRDMDIKNNGHTIQANVALYAAAPTTDVGSFSSVVGHGTNYSSHKWVLEQVHFHWGRTGKTDEGSEHYLQGMAYPLEAHFVHYNSAHGTSVGSAAGTGHAEALLVVGVMFDLNAAGSEPAALTTIADGVAEALYEPKHLSGSVQLSTIYDGMGDFYSYAGSLTTPGCNEMVTWVVMETPKKISMATLEKFKAATAYPKSFESGSDDGMMYTDLIAKYGNYRPLQDKNGRTVYSTSGTTTPCGAVAEPMCSVSSKVSHSWSYDRCDSHYGPTSSAWTSGTSCNNQKGSPINVCGAVPFPGANPTVTTTGWAMTRDMDIKNNGHTIQANVALYAAAPTTDVGSLSSVVGHGTNYSSHKWVLEQVHFHWGRTGKTDEGSEHYLQGMAYPLEAHFVHYNSAHGTSVGSAAGTGHAEALLVVGVMFDLNAAGSEPAALTTIADGVAEALYEPKHLSGSVQLSTIYDGMGDFYSYAGSLTTPGCNEMVTWVVMETPKKISMATLEKFKAATAYPKSFESGSDDGMMYTDLIAKYGNYRPLQDKNGRTVYSTSGTTTPCGAVAEPMCSVSSKVSHSWSYDRCDSHYGPTSSAWTSGTSCNNQKGSPINVCGAVPFPGANPTVTTTGWAMTRDMDIKNNGHTIQANVALYAAAPTTDVGSLSSVVGHGTNYSSHKWVLEQVHFHWGRTGKTDEGSEHYLQGMAYPLEAHFVHYNSAHGTSVGSAAGTGHAEALLVVGVMFDLNAAGSEPAALTTIADGVAEALYEPKHLSGSVQLSTIYDGMGDFYSYAGSLTTPGCNEMVSWVVMETPKKISMATLEKFKAATAYPKSFESGSDDGMMYTDLIAKYGNYRPLQDKNGRTVYSTSGTTTPCGAVAEPMCSVSSKVSHSWSYDRCDSHYGPTSSAWTSGTSCNNQKGSPINVCGAVPFPGANPTVTTTGWAMTRDMDIKNNGHTIQANVASYAAAPTTDVGSLSSVVGHGTNYSSHKWVLEQVHFHWGRTGKTDEGSEHYLQGMAYPLEAHFVHYNSAHGTSVGSAAGTGHAEALLVVGVMFDLNAAGSEPAALTTIADGVAEALYEPKHLSGSVQLSTIYDGMGDFYSYAGSLTTPGCNEMVTWVVMETPKKISMATLEKFKAATAYPKSFESGSDDGMMYTDLIAKYGNYRPLQDKNGRTVYSTSGTTTPCGAVAEPMCSVSSKVSHSWSYDRCDSHYGPTSSAWTSGTSCNNQKGSPINVCGAVPFPGANPTVTTTGWAMTRDMDIKNNGHTIQANVALYAAAPTTDVGSFSSVVGHGTNYSSHKWVLEQVHFHWGRTGKTDEGSEHYLQGMAYPLEAHFVHYNSAHGTSVGSAAGTGHAEALLVVGVMFDLNAAGSEPAALTTIADGVAEALYEPKHLSGSVQLSTIYDGMGDFYSYAGSLTTPGCNEMVSWVVMETPKKISMATLEKFKAATAYPKSFESGSDDGMMYTDLIAKYGNYRPLQDKNGRTVYSTSGTTTPCGAVAEPMCSVSSKVSHSWSYDRCDSHYGPTSSAWTSGTSCNNQKGSPINVCGAVPFPGANPTVTTTGWAMTRDMDIKNNGHTIQANVALYAAAPTTDVGSLSSVVGHGTNYSSHKWVLEQVHFHWGRTGKTDEGSEHYLQGMAYPLEAHFVHYNSAHGTSVGSAAGTGHAEALLVVGVMFDLNAAGSEPAALTTIADGVAEALYEPKHLSGSVQLSTIYDGMGDFYSYAGSLTTPGCNEMVTWVVMETPKKISMATLEKFKAATAYPKSFESGSDDGMMYTNLIAKYGNYRPLQDKNGRMVYSTSGTTTPCGAVAEPMCSVSSKVSHSWSYDRCDSHYGPTSSAWTSGTSCNNQKGSPINVCGAVPFPGANPTVTTTGWAMTRDMDIKNNGHTIQANVALYAAAPTTDVGSLSSVAGHGTNYSSHKWVLEQVHFHWGRTGKTDEGSEHYLQGMAYPLEAHFVHYNSAHGTSVGSAAGTGHAEALLVVGVMFDLNAAGSEPAALTTIADGVAEALYEPKHLSGSVQLSTIYDGMGDFYSYAGSLTTPGCNEMVTWVVMETPKKISMATLEKFKAATAYPKSFESGSDDGMMYTNLIAKYGNYRPLQDKNGRMVYSTSGTTTPCGAVAEPMCSVSSKVSHSWSYDRCDSHYGPTSSAWTSGTSCNNQKGSPINVCGAVPFPGANPTVTTTGWAMTRDMDIKNNGHTIQANVALYAAAPTTDVGSLSSVAGHGTNYSSHKWVLEQVHFHWGRTGKTDEGSEHYLQGMAYPLEAHFVHYNSAHGTSVGSAAGTGHAEALLVVGVMFDLNAAGSEPAALTTIADGVAEALYEPKHLSGSVQLSTIYDGMGDFYSYAGSLTTPGCNEMVTWVVMETPKKISMATLEKFKAATAYPKSFESGSDDGMMYTDLIAKYGNYRPLQDKNGRTVYSTSGTTTPCGPWQSPCAVCHLRCRTPGATIVATATTAQRPVLGRAAPPATTRRGRPSMSVVLCRSQAPTQPSRQLAGP